MKDASQVGLAEVITRGYDYGVLRPFAFASRLLNSAILKCFQVEKEGCAIIYGVKNFFQYARKFTLQTDHKPLLTILDPKKGIPVFAANQLQRWCHILPLLIARWLRTRLDLLLPSVTNVVQEK